jgi:predicted HNH restriction endonuclease
MTRTYKQDPDSLQIKWNLKEHYFIELPSQLFLEACNEDVIEHFIFWDKANGDEFTVNCRLTVKDAKANLDYRNMNTADEDIEDGILVIYFTDSSRKTVERIDWEDSQEYVHKDVAQSNWSMTGEVREGERYLTEAKRLRRSEKLVSERKRKDKYTCQACSYKLQVNGKYIVDCHHLELLSQREGEEITTIDDLITLCPDCHRIAHSNREPLSLEQIKKVLDALK